MNVSTTAAITCVMVAVCTGWVTCLFAGKPLIHERFSTLDGLRGYLAYFVFLYHSFIWYHYLRSGRWEPPPSNLYNHFGQSSVVLFFMITAFLFSSKLLDGRFREIDWTRLYISRFLRLVPLYLTAIFMMFILVAFATDWTLQVSFWDLYRSMFQWIIFTIKSNPNINGLEDTFIVIAGVTWSLPYEWMFYFALPAFGLLLGLPSSNKVKIYTGVALVVMLIVSKTEAAVLAAFLGGMVAAAMVRVDAIRKFSSSFLSSVLIVSALILLVAFYSTAYTVPSMLILSFVFILIASGNTLFGILTSRVSRTLGEMGYGIYLLHGLLLFLVFELLMGVKASSLLSEPQHWAVIGGVTTVLIPLAFVAFKYIEHPCINSTDRALVLFRQLGRR